MTTDNTINLRVIDAINDGEDLAIFFNDLFQNRQTCQRMIGPALSMLAKCFVVARENGYPVRDDASMGDFLKSNVSRICFDLEKSVNSNPELAGAQISSIVASINAARSNGCRWSMPEQRAAQPIPVTVVEMPKRTTTTSVVRGQGGNIVGSTTTETFV